MATQFHEYEVTAFTPDTLIPEYETFQHLVAVGRFGEAPGEFSCPTGISVHEYSGHIYVCDCDNHRIQILSEEGGYLAQFGNLHLLHPIGILVHQNNVYVTDCGIDAIFQFSIQDFSMIKQVGRNGSGTEEFHYPCQMALSPSEFIYVADRYNNRLLILNCSLEFQTTLQHQTMTEPVDIKFSTNGVLVLSFTDSPCIHMFTFSGEKIRSIITRGFEMQVMGAYFFCLDGQNNIIISDNNAHNIKVFSPEGRLFHVIGEYGIQPGMFRFPKCVAILKQTKLVCVCTKYNFSLQIFSSH